MILSSLLSTHCFTGLAEFSFAMIISAIKIAGTIDDNTIKVQPLAIKDVRTQNFPRTDFFKTLTAARK